MTTCVMRRKNTFCLPNQHLPWYYLNKIHDLQFSGGITNVLLIYNRYISRTGHDLKHSRMFLKQFPDNSTRITWCFILLVNAGTRRKHDFRKYSLRPMTFRSRTGVRDCSTELMCSIETSLT